MKKSLIAAGLAAILASGSAAAAIINFDFAGSGGKQSSLTFNANGVQLTASAGYYALGHYDENANPYPYLTQSDKGLGVLSVPYIDGDAIDNKLGVDYAKFVFDRAVQVQSVTIACIGCNTATLPWLIDADASYRVGDPADGDWTKASFVDSAFMPIPSEFTFSLSNLAFDEVFRFGAERSLELVIDSFRILSMQVAVEDVPLPAPLMLLGAGLLALGASRRGATAASSSAAVSR